MINNKFINSTLYILETIYKVGVLIFLLYYIKCLIRTALQLM